MKVKITLTVDIDPAAWDLNYGTGTSAKDIREDVKSHCEGTVLQHLDDLGLLA
jgi:hypothetical protein